MGGIKYLLIVFLMFFTLVSSSQAEIISLDPCGTTSIEVSGSGSNARYVYANNCIEMRIPTTNYNPNILIQDLQKDNDFTLMLHGIVERELGTGEETAYPFASMGFSPSVSKGHISYTNEHMEMGYKILGNSFKTVANFSNLPKNYANSEYYLQIKYKKNRGDSVHWIPVIADGVEQPLIIENKTAGVNTFFLQYMGSSDALVFEIDPIYLVDYSPTPALYLVNGTISSDSDNDFQNQTDITSAMSDNNTLTNYLVNNRRVLYGTWVVENNTGFSSSLIGNITTVQYNFTGDVGTQTYIYVGMSQVHSETGDTIISYFDIDGTAYSDIRIEEHDVDDQWTIATHKVINLSTGDHSFSIIQTPNTNDLVSANFSRVGLVRADPIYYSESETEQTLQNVYTNITNLNIEVLSDSPYLIISTAETNAQDGGKPSYVSTYVDSLNISESVMSAKDNDLLKTYYGYATHSVVNLSTGNHTISIKAKREDTIGGVIRNARVTVLPLQSGYFTSFKSEDVTNTTSLTYVDKLSETASFDAGSYIVWFSGEIGADDKDRNHYTNMRINGDTICEAIHEFKDDSPREYIPVVCMKSVNLTSGNHTFSMQYKVEQADRPTFLRNARITVLSLFESIIPNSAISGRFNKTYDSNYEYYLRFYKLNGGVSTPTIYSYLMADNLTGINITKNISGSGWFNIDVSALMSDMLFNWSLNYSQFRLATCPTCEPMNISELQLREQVNDTQAPSYGVCDIYLEINETYYPQTDFTCFDEIAFRCDNITDDVEVDNVLATINDLNITVPQDGDHYDYYVTPTLNGTLFYNWTWTYIYDISSNVNKTFTNKTATYTCNYNDYINITHVGTVGVDQFNLTNESVVITWTTSNPSTSSLSYTNGSYSSPTLTLNHSVSLSSLAPNTTYFYNITSSDGIVTQTLYNFNFTTSLSCYSNWVFNTSVCSINDTQIVQYYDSVGCIPPSVAVPIENGTEISCNYCDEDLEIVESTCGEDFYANRSYIDNNFTTCCQITGLVSDCSIQANPYNETTQFYCGADELTGISQCASNPNFNIGEKEYCLVTIPANYSSESFKCFSYVKFGSEILQTNPEYVDKSKTLFSINAEEETRPYFTEQNGIVNFYYTKKNLYPKYDYVLGIKCSSDARVLTSEVPLNIDYDDVEVVFGGLGWGLENIQYFIVLLIITFAGGVLAFAFYKSAR